jgi:hypothetical protein
MKAFFDESERPLGFIITADLVAECLLMVQWRLNLSEERKKK